MSNPPIMRECQKCGKSFRIASSHAARPNAGKFCSVPCVNAAKIKRVARSCETCGKPFAAKPCAVAAGHGKFCSIPCANKAKSGVLTTTSAANSLRKASANRFGQPSTPLTTRPVRRPQPITPKQLDWPMESSALVRCARCEQPRARGAACPRCERWDCEGRPVQGRAAS